MRAARKRSSPRILSGSRRPGTPHREIGLPGERLHSRGEFVDGRLIDELDRVAESDAERDGEYRQSEPALVLRERREQEAAADRVAAHSVMLARVPPARGIRCGSADSG